MKINKTRKIIIFIMIISLIIFAILSFLSADAKSTFNDWLYKTYDKEANPKSPIPGWNVEKPDDVVAWSGSIGYLFLWGIFMLFGVLYIYNKKNNRIWGRKWPFIVLILLSSIFGIISLIALFSDAKITQFDVKKSNNANLLSTIKIQNQIIKDKYHSYNIIEVVNYVSLFFTLIILSGGITQLILIKKAKVKIDKEYSAGVQQTANDIQNNHNNQNQSNKENNLP